MTNTDSSAPIDPTTDGTAGERWRPINTAPKDGCAIAGWVEKWKCPVIMYWSGEMWLMPIRERGKMGIPDPTYWANIPQYTPETPHE